MRHWILAVLLAILHPAQAGKAQSVTLVVDDVPVAQVLQALAEQERKNLVISPDVSGAVSLHLTDVPWQQAIQTVVKSAGLVLRQDGSIMHIHSADWRSAEAARREAENARRQASLPLENRPIPLHYADAGELAKAGSALLSPGAASRWINAPTGCWSETPDRRWHCLNTGQDRWIFRSGRSNWRRIS